MSSTHSQRTSSNFTFYPLIWLAVCFASGIFFASQASINWELLLVTAAVCGVASVVRSLGRIALIFVFASFFAAGGFYFETIKQTESTDSIRSLIVSGKIASGDPVELEGTIVGHPELSVGGFYLRLRTDKLIYKETLRESSGDVRFFIPIRDEATEREFYQLRLFHGARIRVAANLTREQRYLNPGSIDFTEILDQKGIDATAIIKSPLLVERITKDDSISPVALVYSFRQRLIESIQAKFSVSTSGILIASLLGNKNFLSKENADIFRNGGTFHVLVISGLHITFIGGILLLIVRRFTRNRTVQFLLTASTLWIYAIAIGAEIPVIRAALMFTVLLFSYVIYRKGRLLNALGASAIIILLWRPGDLFNQSFHLTFVSLTAIIGAAFPLIEKLRAIGKWSPNAQTPFPPKVPRLLKIACEAIYWEENLWQKTLNENVWEVKIVKTPYADWLASKRIQKPLRWIFEGILVTAIVQLFLLPFLIFYFHRVSFGSLVLNLWVGVFIVLQNVSGIIAVSFSSLSDTLALPVVKLTEIFNWFLLVIPKTFIENNLASFRVPIYGGRLRMVYLLYFLPVTTLSILLSTWNPFRNTAKSFKKGIVAATLGLLFFFGVLVFHPYSSPTPDGNLRFDLLDVGQGDAALVTFPNGATMLIDGGGRHKFSELYVEKENGEREEFSSDAAGVGETVVSEFLWENGYSKVDYLVATHADADHLQGLISIVKNFQVREIFVGSLPADDKDVTAFDAAVRSNRIAVTKLLRGKGFEVGGVNVDVLNPPFDAEDSSNNSSVVLRLNFDTKTFLFTGDIEKSAEIRLLERADLLRADVVKVAHHGSRTSSTQEFVDATDAKYAVIPVGRKSPFGHPHKEVVHRWTRAGARVLTTGERGTVTIKTDGKNIEIQRYSN